MFSLNIPPQALVYLPLVLLVGCDSYSGDGVLLEGSDAYSTYRYELDLGQIDLSRKSDYFFKMKGLPEKEFVLGLLIHAEEFSNTDYALSRPINTEVTILLRSQNSIVFEIKAPMSDLIWNIRSSEVFIYGNKARYRTYFTPETNKTYTLEVSISEPITNFPITTAWIKAYADSWK